MFVACFSTIQAQVTTSSITGTVRQSSGGVTEGATIRATHTPSGTSYSGTSNASGRFNLSNLRVGGPYTVEVSYVGQSPAQYNNIYLQLGQPYVLNAELIESSTEIEEVEIIMNQNRKSSKNGISTVINREQMQNLPSISRSVNDFTD